MATVRERGQLLLVGGLALAVVLVAIALVMNAAIYTENLASRDDADRIDEVGAVESDLWRTTGDLMGQARATHPDSYGDQRAAVATGVDALQPSVQYYAAQDGHSVALDYDGATEGLFVEQSSMATLESADGDADWDLVEDANVRAFTMTVDGSSLALDTGFVGDLTGLNGNAFNLELEQDGSTAEVFVYRTASDDVVVEVADDTGTIVGQCVVTDGALGDVTISVTDGEVGGTSCAPLDAALGDETTYTVGYDNGAQATGTFSLVAQPLDGSGTPLTDPTDGLDSDDYDESDPDDPYYDPAVYSVSTSLSVHTPELRYETTLRVAPGENDG